MNSVVFWFQTSEASRIPRSLKEVSWFGNKWRQEDIETCRTKNYDFTYTFYSKFPSWGCLPAPPTPQARPVPIPGALRPWPGAGYRALSPLAAWYQLKVSWILLWSPALVMLIRAFDSFPCVATLSIPFSTPTLHMLDTFPSVARPPTPSPLQAVVSPFCVGTFPSFSSFIISRWYWNIWNRCCTTPSSATGLLRWQRACWDDTSRVFKWERMC